MFLDELQENEREAFLELAYIAMKSSGRINKEELEVFGSYKYECGLPQFEPSDIELNNLLVTIKPFGKEAKRAILIELMGIWAADQKWEDCEIEMMYKVGNSFNIPPKRVNRYRRWSKELREVIAEGYEMIMEG